MTTQYSIRSGASVLNMVVHTLPTRVLGSVADGANGNTTLHSHLSSVH